QPPFFAARFFLDHRATAALRALSFRCLGVNILARALPPLSPPSRPSATAAGFLFCLPFAIPYSSQKMPPAESRIPPRHQAHSDALGMASRSSRVMLRVHLVRPSA